MSAVENIPPENTQTAPEITREAALRIAMAARVLPETSVGQLLEIILRRVTGAVDEAALAALTVTDLKTGFGSADGEEDGEDISLGLPAIKEAVRILWGEVSDESLPEVGLWQSGDVPSVKVAVASNSGEQINGHFGSCIRFLIYQLSEQELTLVDIRSAMEADLAEDKNAFRTELIDDCQVMYVQSIGGPAAARVVRAGIYPIKVKETPEAPLELGRLQERLQEGKAPPWLAKLFGVTAEQRERYSQYQD
ncbi:MAG: dinitrogenase iron-molybdenum cofactor biosynthesis protein [Pseudomonas sp.]|nr:dinitrogenase iron-molybdenum cofactor biosynthesis protein [Pseudomonas sp.]